ncbi:MAG: DNA polymerase Y family protein [Verrucomicrobiota bacterium]
MNATASNASSGRALFAVVHLPDFALQAVLRHEPEAVARPVALVDPAQTTPRVFQCTPAARDGGVELGHTAVQAMARCRSVVIRHRSTKQEAAAVEAMLQVAFGFTPHLELTGPGMMTLDLRGLAELRDEDPDTAAPRLAAWARRLQTALGALGLTARIGTGPTPNVARHAARWSSGIELVGDAPAFIASLPVAALAPSPHVADILHQWGVRTVGEVLALGPAELAERLGLESFALLAAASTGTVRPLNLVRPTERFVESLEFDPPIETLEPLLFLLRRFAEQLGHRLECCGLVAASLRLTLRQESGATLEHVLRIPQPTRAADALFRMLHTHLESVRTDTAIAGVELLAEPTRPEQRQFTLFEAALRDPNQFQETLARLSALVGADRVGTPVRVDTHRPDTFRLVPPDFEHAPPPPGASPADFQRPTPMRRLRPAPTATVNLGSAPESAAPPPPGLVRFPESDVPPAAVPGDRTSPPGPMPPRPVALNSAVASGRITLAVGPRRLSGDWWDASASWQQEEWDVETHRRQVLRLTLRNGEWTLSALAD